MNRQQTPRQGNADGTDCIVKAGFSDTLPIVSDVIHRKRLLLAVSAAALVARVVATITAFGLASRYRSPGLPSVITQTGRYDLPSGAKIRVKESNGCIEFEVTTEAGTVLVDSGKLKASKYSRWALMLDTKARLWFYSGDIGLYVFVRDDRGEYALLPNEASAELMGDMPQSFRDAIGSAARHLPGVH